MSYLPPVSARYWPYGRLNTVLRAVLFDFGGVFTLSPFPVIADAAPELGLTPEAAIELCFGVYDKDGDHPWHRLERGEISLEDARAALSVLAREQEIEIDILALFGRMGKPDPDREVMVEGARQIRERGLRTALVTNNVAEFGDGWRKMVPVDELFEVIIDSSAVGVRKPDPRIFQLALDALGVAAHEAAFVDDHPGNIRAAEELGMVGILVGPDRPQALVALNEALAAAGV